MANAITTNCSMASRLHSVDDVIRREVVVRKSYMCKEREKQNHLGGGDGLFSPYFTHFVVTLSWSKTCTLIASWCSPTTTSVYPQPLQAGWKRNGKGKSKYPCWQSPFHKGRKARPPPPPHPLPFFLSLQQTVAHKPFLHANQYSVELFSHAKPSKLIVPRCPRHSHLTDWLTSKYTG